MDFSSLGKIRPRLSRTRRTRDGQTSVGVQVGGPSGAQAGGSSGAQHGAGSGGAANDGGPESVALDTSLLDALEGTNGQGGNGQGVGGQGGSGQGVNGQGANGQGSSLLFNSDETETHVEQGAMNGEAAAGGGAANREGVAGAGANQAEQGGNQNRQGKRVRMKEALKSMRASLLRGYETVVGVFRVQRPPVTPGLPNPIVNPQTTN